MGQQQLIVLAKYLKGEKRICQNFIHSINGNSKIGKISFDPAIYKGDTKIIC